MAADRLPNQIVHAAELHGRGWINTDRDLSLDALRGKFALLDFWTFCCINCLHVLDELRPLEETYENELVIIGVHSPKFEHERDPQALRAAVERYEVNHPVLDDPSLLTWQAYGARAWPTLALIDPEGYVIFSMAGEGHTPGLLKLMEELVPIYRERGTLVDAPAYERTAPVVDTPLRFPGKATTSNGGGYWVSSTAQHQIVELAADAETVVRRIGSGVRGHSDGAFDAASFSEPQGVLQLPQGIAQQVGYDLVVADSVNHMLRGISLSDNTVRTVAGTGAQWRRPNDTDRALDVDLSSPWDLAWFENRVIIAMAGIHQLWWFDPMDNTAGVYCGTTVEALGDGPIADAWMAQPSGLSALGDTLWIADSETSALRYIRNGVIRTAIGTGLFDFGSVDGPAKDALLQHPLGVLATDENTVMIADTYNGRIRQYDIANETVSTLATGLAEPSDVIFAHDGSVLVVESNAHAITPLGSREAQTSDPSRFRTERPPIRVAPGPVSIEVAFQPPAGQKLDEQFGPSTRLSISASPQRLLTGGTGDSTKLRRDVTIGDGETNGVLQVIAQAATCDTEGEHPACHLIRQDWGVPVIIDPEGESTIRLVLHDTPT